MYYSKSKKDHLKGNYRGWLNIEECIYIKPSIQRPKKTYVFEIPTPDRTYYFSAPSPQEMQDWIICLRKIKMLIIEKKDKKIISNW